MPDSEAVYCLEVWVQDGERWRWDAVAAYPTLDMAVSVGEGFVSARPYRVRRVMRGCSGFAADEVHANGLTCHMRLLRSKIADAGKR